MLQHHWQGTFVYICCSVHALWPHAWLSPAMQVLPCPVCYSAWHAAQTHQPTCSLLHMSVSMVINQGPLSMKHTASSALFVDGCAAVLLCWSAGLSAARQLRNHGYKVLVLEGADRPGGRVHTHRLEVSGWAGDTSQKTERLSGRCRFSAAICTHPVCITEGIGT